MNLDLPDMMRQMAIESIVVADLSVLWLATLAIAEQSLEEVSSLHFHV